MTMVSADAVVGDGAGTRPTRFRRRIANQARVISALVIREMMSEHGRHGLGFLWLIVEPMFLVSGVLAIWSFRHDRGELTGGVPILSFVLTGYMPLTLWRHLSNTTRILSINFGLLYHRPVTLLDIMLARGLSEVLTVFIAGSIIYLMLLSLGLVELVYDPGIFLAGWLLFSWFSFAAGTLVAALSEGSDIYHNLIGPVQYLILPICGCFFLIAWLPHSVQKIMVWVPLPNFYEMIRAGYFGPMIETHYSVPYIVIWCASLTAIALWRLSKARKVLTRR